MRIPLIEYKSIKQKDGSRKTVSSYEPLSITQEDFIEIKELLRLAIQLEERLHSNCKNCKEKKEIGCRGCLWDQIGYLEGTINFTLRGALMALGKEDTVDKPDWEKKKSKEFGENLLKYLSVLTPRKYVPIEHFKQAKWRIKNGSTK